MNTRLVKVDNIDNMLGCIRPRWHRNAGSADSFTASKKYTSIPVERIRGIVNVIVRNLENSHLESSIYRGKGLEKLVDWSTSRLLVMFYKNNALKYKPLVLQDWTLFIERGTWDRIVLHYNNKRLCSEIENCWIGYGHDYQQWRRGGRSQQLSTIKRFY